MNIPNWQEFIDFLNDVVEAILDFLNEILRAINSLWERLDPLYYIVQFAMWFVQRLPDDTGLDIDNALVAMSAFGHYISWLDYFINMPVFVSAFGTVVIIEFACGIIRTWRIIRSFVT